MHLFAKYILSYIKLNVRSKNDKDLVLNVLFQIGNALLELIGVGNKSVTAHLLNWLLSKLNIVSPAYNNQSHLNRMYQMSSVNLLKNLWRER